MKSLTQNVAWKYASVSLNYSTCLFKYRLDKVSSTSAIHILCLCTMVRCA